jgi:hypothetical protein
MVHEYIRLAMEHGLLGNATDQGFSLDLPRSAITADIAIANALMNLRNF